MNNITKENKTLNKGSNTVAQPGTGIRVYQDHLYFYSEINDQTALDFNIMLTDLALQHAQCSVNGMFEAVKPSPIWLHINSPGGSVIAAMAMLDTMNRIKHSVPIVTIVEGCAASAGTFLSVAGTHRTIRENSYVLIHQLSSALWGKYTEMKDDMKNSENFMKAITKLYKKHTKLSPEKLTELLSHDLYLDAKTALKYGLVDQIII